MGLNPNALLIPGKGTAFFGNVDATIPTVAQLATASPASPPPGFTGFGHTSRQNLPKYGEDGGDSSQQGSWWDEAIRSTSEATARSLEFASLQVIDAPTLALALPGGTHNSTLGTYSVGSVGQAAKSLLLLIVDGAKRMGVYHPNVSLKGKMPEDWDLVQFLEMPLTAQLLSSPTTGDWMTIISADLVVTP